MLLKLCSVLSLIAFRNVGTKNAVGFKVYSSWCKGCKSLRILVSLGNKTTTKTLASQMKKKTILAPIWMYLQSNNQHISGYSSNWMLPSPNFVSMKDWCVQKDLEGEGITQVIATRVRVFNRLYSCRYWIFLLFFS